MMLILMSISILDGNWVIWKDCRLIAEVKNNLFANSLIDATIQDSGKRERSNGDNESTVYC